MYVTKLTPRQCQVEALAALENKSAFALHMAMRTGKSKVIIDDFGRLQAADQVDNLLIIATGGSYRTWGKQLEDHAGEPLASSIVSFVWDSRRMKNKEKLRELAHFEAIGNKPRCLMINIEALSNVKLARATVERFVKAKRCMVVIDESTSIRNPSAKRTKYVVDKIGKHAKFRRTLTGLPNPKSPLDFFSQFEFLDATILGHKTFASFQERYAIIERQCFMPKDLLAHKLRRVVGDRIHMNGFGTFAIEDLTSKQIQEQLSLRNIWFPNAPIIKGFKNQDELKEKLKPFVYRKTLEECYDLPPKTYIRREVLLTGEQQKAYDEMQAFFTTQLENEEHVTAANVITCMLKLHQILCGHVKDEQGIIHNIPSKRVDSLIELLNEYEGKAIIWCSYDLDVRAIATALGLEFGDETVARFWGGNKNTREQDERSFLQNDNCRFMVATPAAGGKGRTWVNADLVVYYSNSHDLEHRVQSEERAQGVGKTNSVAYVDMVAPSTVDEKILMALKHKWNLASYINDDNWRSFL